MYRSGSAAYPMRRSPSAHVIATCMRCSANRARRSRTTSPAFAPPRRRTVARPGSTSRFARSSRPPNRRRGQKQTQFSRASRKATRGAPLRTRGRNRAQARRLAARGDVHDERLWTPIAGASSGSGNTTALVGTPEQVADAVARYYDIGVSGVLLRGFDPVADAREYGRELIPLIREKVAAAGFGNAALAPGVNGDMARRVVVVGGGNAALCAAISARECGAQVTLLERAPFELRGGNTRFTAGAMRAVYDGVDDLVRLMPDLTASGNSNAPTFRATRPRISSTTWDASRNTAAIRRSRSGSSTTASRRCAGCSRTACAFCRCTAGNRSTSMAACGSGAA